MNRFFCFVLFFAASVCCSELFAQKPPIDNRPDQKEVLLEKVFIEAMREKVLGNNEEAVARFLEVIQKDNNNDVANFELARIYHQLEQFDKAIIRAARAVELNSKNLDYNSFYASLLEKKGDYNKAAALYEKLTALYPDNSFLYYEWAYYLIKDDQKDQAIKVYNALEKRKGIMAELSIRKHKLYLSINKEKKAIQELEKLIDAFPNNVEHLVQLAGFYANINKSDKARVYFEKALKIDPSNPNANIAMADVFRKEGDTLRFIAALAAVFEDPQQSVIAKIKVLEPLVNETLQKNNAEHQKKVLQLAELVTRLHPENTKGHILLGYMLSAEKRFDEALIQYEIGLAVDPNQMDIWVQVLASYNRMGNNELLLSKSTAFIDLYPSQAVGFYYNGIALNHKGDFIKAEKTLKEAINMSVSDLQLQAFAYAALGESLSGQAAYGRADENFEKALQLLPTHSVVLNAYCRSLLARNENLTKAEDLAKKLLQADDKLVEHINTYAWMLYRKEKFQEAKSMLQKAISSSASRHPESLERFGDVLFKLGEKDLAVDYWKKAQDNGAASSLLKRKIETKQLYE